MEEGVFIRDVTKWVEETLANMLGHHTKRGNTLHFKLNYCTDVFHIV